MFGGADRVVDQRTPSRAEPRRAAAQITDVLVPAHRPEPRGALVDGIFVTQAAEHRVVVVAQKERGFTRVDLVQAEVRTVALPAARASAGRRSGNSTPLVPGHGGSVLCSAVGTRDDRISGGATWQATARGDCVSMRCIVDGGSGPVGVGVFLAQDSIDGPG
jgi:hypothetical protein